MGKLLENIERAVERVHEASRVHSPPNIVNAKTTAARAKAKTKRRKLSRTKITSPLRYLRALLSAHTLTHTHTDFTFVNLQFSFAQRNAKKKEKTISRRGR